MNGHAHRAFVATMAACVVVIVVALIATTWYTAHVTNERRSEQIAGCERANIQRRYINAILKELDMPLEPIVVPVCEDIIR